MPTLSELNNRASELADDMARTTIELTELADRRDAGAVQRRDNIMRHAEKLQEQYEAVVAERTAVALAGIRSGRFKTEAGADFGQDDDDTPQRPGPGGFFPLGGGNSRANTRGEALRSIERVDVADAAKERFTVEVERATGEHFDRLTAWTTATSDPAYLRRSSSSPQTPSTATVSSPAPS